MKRLLLCLGLLLILGVGYSQGSKLRLSLNTDLASKSINTITFNPGLMYFVNDKMGVGAHFLFSDYMGFKQKEVSANVRYYVHEDHCYVQAGVNTDFDNSGFNISTGYTSYLGRFFIEPAFQLMSQKQETKFSLILGIGCKL